MPIWNRTEKRGKNNCTVRFYIRSFRIQHAMAVLVQQAARLVTLMPQGGVLHHPVMVLCGRQDQSDTLWQQKLQQGRARLHFLGARSCCILHFPEALQSGCAAEQATDRRMEGVDAGHSPGHTPRLCNKAKACMSSIGQKICFNARLHLQPVPL